MATVKSKLKEQLQKENEMAVDELINSNTLKEGTMARKWVESIARIKKVCDERNRY